MTYIDDFIGTKFGPSSQLEVVGWFGHRIGSNKKYTVECSICKEDAELYGDGRFLIPKSKIEQGRVPCGCSERVVWTKEQYKVLVKRECLDRGYRFITFSGKFCGKNSKIILETPTGYVDEVLLSNFMKGQDTISLKREKIGEKNRKDDSTLIANFTATGAYAEGTLFSRSTTRVNNDGWRSYWNVYCPVCDEAYECHLSNLSRGSLGCSCSKRRHNKSYIHILLKDEEILGIKYGITSVTTGRRLKEQAKKSSLTIEEFGLWEYDEVSSCRKSEADVKKIYNNFITKEVLPDGYTETAPFCAIEHIIQIFENGGGIRVN